MMETRKRILWVDDDTDLADAYLEMLRTNGFLVDYYPDIDGAVCAIQGDRVYDLVIWDLALAPGETFASAPTRGGLDTGRHFHDLVRNKQSEVPMLLFTNFRHYTADWQRPEQHDFAMAKRDVVPSGFVRQVRELVR